MKRHPALVPLSRDHHHVLVIAQQLRRATRENTAEATRAFLDHWETEEKQHFRLEEEVLLPAYAAHGDPGHPAVTRMLQDHILIRRDADRVASEPSLELLRDLGKRLADHVKLEEREVFPLIETTIPEPELEALCNRLHHTAT
ncbi:MAG: hemerythrin domain-containing protein [Solirubrobacteraceae bacterium]